MLELLNSFKRYLLNTVPKIVTKDKEEADMYETVESRRLGDIYCSASLEMDSLITYSQIHEISLKRAGISDKNQIREYLKDKSTIPKKYHDIIIRSERSIFLSEFEETNEYYRMLMGLPPLGEDYIFLDYAEMELYGFHEIANEDDYEHRTPFHLLPKNTLEAMDKSGYLEELQKMFPESRYISYVGQRKIDLAIARMAGNFALIYLPKVDATNRFYRDFSFHYDEAREYFLSTVYNFSYSSQYPHYNGMIGFMILHMAIHRMISTTFKVMVDRDFYDLETCRIFLESYKIPFEKLFSITQQKMIIKNLNLLLMNKHTPRVLYDVLDLLGYDNIDITKYLLVKQHKLFQKDVESDLIPSFSYKLMVDDAGQQYIELDNSSMYEYYFVGVDMLASDVHLDTIDAANTFGYTEFTENDALWIHDDELIDKLEKAEINYVETKYANIAITFRMHEKNFELIYLSRLILDKQNETSRIFLDIPMIVNVPQSLFDIQVLLICLLCKKSHMETNLLKSPSEILYILGFNFKADLEAIKKDIKEHPSLYDETITKYLENIIFVSPEDVNRMYLNVKNLERFLTKAMQETPDPNVYHAYKKLYNTIFYSELNNSMYTLTNGNTANSYMEYMQDKNQLLYEFVESVEEDKIADYIDYIATKFSTLFPDTEFMNYLAPVDAYLIDAILKMLRAFKSYTIDIRDIDVIYRFDSRRHNLLKLIFSLRLTSFIHPNEVPLKYSDWINEFRGTVYYNEIKNILYELANISSTISNYEFKMILKEKFWMYTKLHLIDMIHFKYGDRINVLSSSIRPKDTLKFKDNHLRFVMDDVEYSPRQIGTKKTFTASDGTQC